ncbi:hypothetical protein [Spiroplasma endosymbiont of Zeiraphera isertana]|uniref:hypothetical protein n=1 Tax=Spiroplasma endosymbiont of Zeiraphera isertana TaxID=3066313 RepID=UPI00313DFCFE
MAIPQIPKAFIIGGNSPTENAVLSVLEAQVRGELTAELSTLFMRNTVTADQIANISGVAMAIYRATVRVLWGSTWDEFTGTKRQKGTVKTTTLIIDKELTIDFNIPEFDIERFMTSPANVATQIVSNWTSSFMRNLRENFELIFLQGTKDYAIAKSLVLPLNLNNMTKEQALNAYYKIGEKNNKLIKKVDDITVGINKADLTGACGIDSSFNLAKAFTLLNYGQIAANTLATGKRYTNQIMGMEFYESFYLEQDFIHDTVSGMHLEKDYKLLELFGVVYNRYMWGMPISFTKVRNKLDNATDNIRIIGKALYSLPAAIRPNLMYIIQEKMPTVDEIKEARAKNYKVDATNINATYQSTDYDNMNILDLQDVIYYKNLGKITMAGTTPTNDELETIIINIGNNGYEKGKTTFSNITSTSAIISGNNKDYYGTVKLEFTKK